MLTYIIIERKLISIDDKESSSDIRGDNIYIRIKNNRLNIFYFLFIYFFELKIRIRMTLHMTVINCYIFNVK